MPEFSYKSFLRNYYLVIFFYDFIFAYAIYTVLFSIRGLSVFQISILIAWWAFVSIFFEVPSGALADFWSRRKMLFLAPLIKAACFIIWFFADGNFFLYALGFTFWALSESFITGTSQALLYDTLSFAGKKDEYEKILGRSRFFLHIALGISIFSGGFIAAYDLDWAVLFSVLPLAFSAFFAFRLQEVPKMESTREVHYFQFIKEAFKEIRGSRILFYLFIYLLSIYIFGVLEEFDQLYFEMAGLPIFAFGIAGLFWSVLNAAGSAFAFRLKNLRFIYYLFPLISAAMLALVALFPGIPMIALLLLAYFICSPLIVLTESNIQHNISGTSRATVTSVGNLLASLSSVAITLFLGFLARLWGLPAIYLAAAAFLFLLAAWAFTIRNKFNSG